MLAVPDEIVLTMLEYPLSSASGATISIIWN